jgi:hypothetical protein
MRIQIGLLVTIITSLLARQSSAVQPAQPSLPAECKAPSVKAFDKTIKNLLSLSQASGKPLPEFWSKDATFRKFARSPKTTLSAVEKHIRCYQDQSLDEAWLASLTLVCVDLPAQLQYIKRLAQAPKSQVNGWALYYAVWPGRSWSNTLALNYKDENVRAALREVAPSPNATPGLQRLVMEILDGVAKNTVDDTHPEMLLSCESGKGE